MIGYDFLSLRADVAELADVFSLADPSMRVRKPTNPSDKLVNLSPIRSSNVDSTSCVPVAMVVRPRQRRIASSVMERVQGKSID